jgi:flagellar biosynthesis GTPase FlhF
MKRILLSSLLALGLIVSIAPPALAADTQPPILLDWKLIDEKVDISSGDATARVEFSISDDSEIDSWVIVLLGSRTSTQASGLVFSKLTSKVGKISTYQATATIGFGKAPGEWSWTLYPLKDVLGNDSSRFGPGGAWPVTIMVFDKDFTEAKYLADLKAAEEKATAELKAKQEADEKAAADKAAAELKSKQEADAKAAADKAAAELKAKQEADAKAAADKAAAELKAKQEAEATSTRLKSELTSEANKLLVLIEKLLKTATAGASKNELISLKSTLNTLTLEFNRGILFEGALLSMYKNDLIGLNLKYSKIYSALNKKTTITCIKGKLTKKVTAVKPVCPKGYKKK